MAKRNKKPAGDSLHVSRSAERALMLLSLTIDRGSVPLVRAAEATNLSPSTALRHFKVLEMHGLVRRDDEGLFSAGPEFLRLALTALRQSPAARLIEVVEPHLQELVDRTGESAYMAIQSDDEAIYVATVESPQTIRHAGWTGRTVPIDITAVGEALVAQLDSNLPLPTFINVGAVEADVTAVAGPVADSGGEVVAALSVIGPTYRIPKHRYSELQNHVSAAAARVSEQLGYQPANTRVSPAEH